MATFAYYDRAFRSFAFICLPSAKMRYSSMRSSLELPRIHYFILCTEKAKVETTARS